jgi:hypothetical protein
VPSSNNVDWLPLSGRILRRALDHRKYLDYAWIAALAACPLLYARLIGADEGFDGFAAYDDQWPLMVLLLPVALFLLRWTMNRIAPVSVPWPPPSVPAIVELIETEEGKKSAYEALRGALLSPKILVAALLVTVVIHVLDLQQLAGFYIAGPLAVCKEQKESAVCAEDFDSGSESRKELRFKSFTVERDWSVMFLSSEKRIEKWQNLALNLSAYSIQFILILISIVLVLLILRHNLFFLSRIYQRRRVPAGEEYSYIHVDLDDDDKCFGFRRANDAFNTQVLALFVAGLFILFTRFNNISPGSGLFPDAGQWLSVIIWLAALTMVALPIGVKLMPRLSLGSERSPASIVNYLREFLSDDAWASGNDPASEEVAAVAARFAENSFWPTGNNRARWLFFLSFCVFFVGLVPDPRAIETFRDFDQWVQFVSWGVSGCLAWGSTLLLFALLRGMLSYVDERLVKPPQHPIANDAARRQRHIPIGLFISYRRDDTAPYAGRLRDSLAAHIDRERIFMDIDTISGGVDFQHAIDESIDSAQAMIVVIGLQWLEIEDEHGHPRIQKAEDFVRMEVASGLKAGLRVFPVLVDGAAMPSAAELPEDIKELARLNACEISNTRWDHDVRKLLGDLEGLRIPKKRGG